MVIAKFEKVCVLCQVHTKAHETVKYLVYNTRWQHACGWNKILVCSKNKRKTEESSQGVEDEYYCSLSHDGHLDINRKLSYLISVLVRISFLPPTNLHITFFKIKMNFCRLVN